MLFNSASVVLVLLLVDSIRMEADLLDVATRSNVLCIAIIFTENVYT